ncbi:FAD/NAD(P)-binding domain-containing protein [Aulographum hederae CBS 113979]|uniref:FAD/NAD(P)-binding domain-containing protein n=1 Tax=Aulographum hederae CBS 113979 TaxID=1176131 RepID=A0A6G1GPX2_9PEZI|nr:FAD/NAD(P)-binding domain-containing protein [Aulographum hederae CBS 113979]
MGSEDIPILQQVERAEGERLKILIIGAGLAGLSASLSLTLASHTITLLESTPTISAVGAGIQILPNASRTLYSWGLRSQLLSLATRPSHCEMRNWRGGELARMGFEGYERRAGTEFLDFHRAELLEVLLQRARELGVRVRTGCRVVDVETGVLQPNGRVGAVVVLASGERLSCDIAIGADGINSRTRECMLGRKDPPTPTGDLAYRLLLDPEEMLKDDLLRHFVEEPKVVYWLGDKMHAVGYVVKRGGAFNMVLLVPDDMPREGPSTLEGSVEEMRGMFEDWDPCIPRLLSLCKSVSKWRLSIRQSCPWYHPSGTFTLLGDAVHATLPYLASGAGMALEDAAVLGLCLLRVSASSTMEERLGALRVYERCRKGRTEKVVQRGNLQQEIYHFGDGESQRERDALFKRFQDREEEGVHRGRRVGEGEDGEDPFVWRWEGSGRWLLLYDAQEDVERNWAREERGAKL